MKKKLTLDDLRVQSFVTTIRPEEAQRMVGGSNETDGSCTAGHYCNTMESGCGDGSFLSDAGCGCSDATSACGACESDTCSNPTSFCPTTNVGCGNCTATTYLPCSYCG